MGIKNFFRNMFATPHLIPEDMAAFDHAVNAGATPDIQAIYKRLEEISSDPDANNRINRSLYNQGQVYVTAKLNERVEKELPGHEAQIKTLSPNELKKLKTPEELFARILKGNGIAFGDVHTSREAHEYIASHMKFFKDNGAKFIAVELLPASFQPILDKICSAPTMEQKLKNFDNFSTAILEITKNEYPSKEARSQDMEGTFKIVRAAIQTGLPVACMEINSMPDGINKVLSGKSNIRDEVREFKLRVAQTNFEWVENIRQFKASHNISPDANGLIVGGEIHLDDQKLGHADEMSHMVSIGFQPKGSEIGVEAKNKSFAALNNGLKYSVYIDDNSGELKSVPYAIMNEIYGKAQHPKDLPAQHDTAKRSL